MTKTSIPGKGDAEARILLSGTELFTKFGYICVNTDDNAVRAEVREVTIYWQSPLKRDLYLAVLNAELRQVRLRSDLLA